MPVTEPLNFDQPSNELSSIADIERRKLLPKNDYTKTSFEYSTVNPNALADGDGQGKGTGDFLDVYNQAAGTIQDIVERRTQKVINEYQPDKPYTTPSA